MTILLCDVGGTHIRFALSVHPGKLGPPEKLRVDLHDSLQDAITTYLLAQAIKVDAIDAFYLAFSNRNSWDTTEVVLRTVLPRARLVQVNDFEANALGLIDADSNDLVSLWKGEGRSPDRSARAVLGVGTGLGLAYIQKGSVHRTHGGHMLPAYGLPEHGDVFSELSRQRQDGTVPIYEDVLSGRGLFALYRLLCHQAHLNPEYHDVRDLLISGKDDPVMRQTLTLFHEILGVFTHQAVAFGYAYGGVYLTGGIIDRLMTSGLFQTDPFLAQFHQKTVEIVRKDVLSAPVWWVRDEFISLRGLLRYAQTEGIKQE